MSVLFAFACIGISFLMYVIIGLFVGYKNAYKSSKYNFSPPYKMQTFKPLPPPYWHWKVTNYEPKKDINQFNKIKSYKDLN